MGFKKETLITGFAIFSLFFGAGNLILPPLLGYNSGDQWSLVTLGFVISAVFIPILGIFAHARLQGTMLDFASKVHPKFSLVFCILIYLVAITLPGPRTASLTYEMALQPYFTLSSLTLSSIYFGLVLLFTLNRSKILDLLGKYLTPLLLIILITIIGIACFAELPQATTSSITNPVRSGILEGYQTFDAIGAIVIGAVIVISLKLRNQEDFNTKKKILKRAAILAGMGLFSIYTGLIYIGSLYRNSIENPSRTDLLSFLSYETLGSGGRLILAFVVSIACFTTAVGIVTGTADFVKGLFKNSQKAYVITVILGCLIGVIIGQTGVAYIIEIAVPALNFIYPLVIVLIVLNALPEKYTSQKVFRIVVLTTIFFSIPDFLKSLNILSLENTKQLIPLAEYGITWFVPTILSYGIARIAEYFTSKAQPLNPED
ncbi:branched-chain amino acid transport system II carrier protein [Leeuwenhoekiella polynyae]|uniref:LIVCS family branched-chain amino acid:cation transporter n=1 Tax=Leeuwenhoekiella polynyae TaxID=1550906 RepID=A0A4Q0P2Z4_9FLAO|nr:branched-chain amino acid transport system II carrier protein [Leeuwenhoekiella polynyae]RXG20934.1 LIVCS family branched-chain amino acid:cation transporter [Leeuwenhoekiella polynyae]